MSEKIKNPKDENVKINNQNNSIEVSVNPRIFPLPVIIRAVNNFTDKAYTCIDGNPSERILVKLVFHDKNIDLGKMGHEFNTELVSSYVTTTNTRGFPGGRPQQPR